VTAAAARAAAAGVAAAARGAAAAVSAGVAVAVEQARWWRPDGDVGMNARMEKRRSVGNTVDTGNTGNTRTAVAAAVAAAVRERSWRKVTSRGMSRAGNGMVTRGWDGTPGRA
jgi:hypothetical protein